MPPKPKPNPSSDPDPNRTQTDYDILEMTTDAAVELREMEWRQRGLSDEALAGEWQQMYTDLCALNERSLREPLQHTDPRALFDLVRYAKHLGMWKNYHHNQGRLKYVVEDLG